MRVRRSATLPATATRLREAIIAHREASRSSTRPARINVRLWDAVKPDDGAP